MALPHWTHDRRRFYKYMTAATAIAVLRNNTLRWSVPLLFNDPFDVQFDLHVEYDRKKVAVRVMQSLADGYLGRQQIPKGNAAGVMLTLLKDLAPGISEQTLRRKLEPGIYEGMERAEARLPQTHKELREAIAGLKLLCLSEIHDNILMWSHYGKDHSGVVLELSCIENFDSPWGAAKPVRYMDKMPLLVDEEKLVSLMSGEGTIAEPEAIDNSVFVKAADWAYEKEWRLVGGRNRMAATEDIPFHVEEATAVYLGCRMSRTDRDEVESVVTSKFPHATLHLARKSERRFALEFQKIK